MDLNTRYGLEFDPFLKNAREILYEGAEFREALFRLDYLSRTKGFGVLTGSPWQGQDHRRSGMGKEAEPVPVSTGIHQPLDPDRK